jgi:hypothetical protein
MTASLVTKPLPPKGESPLADIVREMDFLDRTNGPWMAGGAALSLAMGHRDVFPGGDIDLFFNNKAQAEDIYYDFDKYLTKMGLKRISNHVECEEKDPITRTICVGNASLPKPYYFQFIMFRFASEIETLFSRFDFSVTKFVCDTETVSGPQPSWDDLETKTLRFEGWNPKSMWRFPKYCMRGFTPTPETIIKMIETGYNQRTQHAYVADTMQFDETGSYE